MRIRVDAEQASQCQRALAPAPVHVQPPRVSVDLDRHAMLGAGAQNALHVDLVARSPHQLPSRDMTQDGRMRVLDGLDDPVRLLLAAEPELAVNAGDDQVETGK